MSYDTMFCVPYILNNNFSFDLFTVYEYNYEENTDCNAQHNKVSLPKIQIYVTSSDIRDLGSDYWATQESVALALDIGELFRKSVVFIFPPLVIVEGLPVDLEGMVPQMYSAEPLLTELFRRGNKISQYLFPVIGCKFTKCD